MLGQIWAESPSNAATVMPSVRGDEKMTSLSWAPFALVAELNPYATIVSYQSLPTDAYPRDSWGKPNPEAKWFNHHVAVMWDEDRDTRVLHALAYLMYAAPRAASRISALGEHKGCLTVWAAWIDHSDWLAFENASKVTQIGDYWPVEVRELVFEPPDLSNSNTLWTVHDKSPSNSADTRKPRGLEHEDVLVSHINGLYPLGWWGARRRGETGQ